MRIDHPERPDDFGRNRGDFPLGGANGRGSDKSSGGNATLHRRIFDELPFGIGEPDGLRSARFASSLLTVDAAVGGFGTRFDHDSLPDAPGPIRKSPGFVARNKSRRGALRDLRRMPMSIHAGSLQQHGGCRRAFDPEKSQAFKGLMAMVISIRSALETNVLGNICFFVTVDEVLREEVIP